MLQRRTRLAVLTILLVGGIIATSEAGNRKRARRFQQYYCPPPCVQATSPPPCVQAPSGPILRTGTSVICPMFKWADRGSYCSWYAIPCLDGVAQNPVSYDGACTAGPKSPCGDCLIQCPPYFTTATYATGPAASSRTPSAHQYDACYEDGFAGKLFDPRAPALSQDVVINPKMGVFEKIPLKVDTKTVYAKIKVDLPNSAGTEVVCVELIKAEITADPKDVSDKDLKNALSNTVEFAAGHQITDQSSALKEGTYVATPVPKTTRVFEVEEAGVTGATKYLVILQAYPPKP